MSAPRPIACALALAACAEPGPAPADPSDSVDSDPSVADTEVAPCEITDPCAAVNAATAGATVEICGDMGDDRAGQGDGCDVHAEVDGVHVTGGWKGDLRCHHCDGWVFEDLEITEGSLRFIGGDGWTLRDSTIDGGARGIMAVVGTGSDDTVEGQCTNWTIERITSRNAGCRPEDDPYPTHARALYIIGKNGVPNNGLVQDSRFEGDGCAATVKIGGTGNFGSWSGAPDAADAVVFRNNTIDNLGSGLQPQALLLATNSDDLTIEGNTLIAEDLAMSASGPWSGRGLQVVDNTIAAPTFLLGRVWNYPDADALAVLFGEHYVTYEEPGDCPEVGTCTGNVRPD